MTIDVHYWKFSDRDTFPLSEWVNSLPGDLMFVSNHPFNASAMWAITRRSTREVRTVHIYDASEPLSVRRPYREWLNSIPGKIINIHHADVTEVVAVTYEEIDDG